MSYTIEPTSKFVEHLLNRHLLNKHNIVLYKLLTNYTLFMLVFDQIGEKFLMH